ncbi:MAG: hypothetical protein J4452_03640 [Candidatus Aenigmarchaeota archaeon]|nr:hypothetical protein [Candidatus Aenigmarchaeota archaeon]
MERAEYHINIKLSRQGFEPTKSNRYLLLTEGADLDETRLAIKSGLLRRVPSKQPGKLAYMMHGIPLSRVEYRDLGESLIAYEQGLIPPRIVVTDMIDKSVDEEEILQRLKENEKHKN